VLKKYSVTFAGQILVYIAGFLLIPIIVKTSGTEVYGAYVIIVSFLGILTGVSSLGTGFLVKRFLPSIDNKEERANIFYPQFYFNILSAILLGIIAFLSFSIIEEHLLGVDVDFDEYLVVLYLILYILYTQTTDVFRYTHKVNLFNISTTLYPYIFLIIIVLWYRFDEIITINTLIISQIIALAVVFVSLLLPSIKSVSFKLTWYKKYTFIKDIKYGFPLMIVVIFELIISVSDRYVIASYMDLDSVAFYTIAYSVSSIPLLLPKVIGIVLPPIMSKLKDKGGKDKIALMINSALFIFCMIIFPFTIGVIMLGDPLLSLYTNKETAAAAAGLLPIITMAIFFYGVGSILSSILFVDMKTKSIFLANSVAGLLNLIANIVIFSIINDIYVAAWTTFCSYFLYMVLIYSQINKEYVIKLLNIKIVKIALSSFIMAMALYFIKSLNFDFYTIEGLVFGVVIGCVVYIGSLFVSRAIVYKDILLLIGKNSIELESE
jgi:O-antigen/teichoic acid export membrane protein